MDRVLVDTDVFSFLLKEGHPRGVVRSGVADSIGLPFLYDHRRTQALIECGDCWVAATAVRHGLPLMTHNHRHFGEIGSLRLISMGQ